MAGGGPPAGGLGARRLGAVVGALLFVLLLLGQLAGGDPGRALLVALGGGAVAGVLTFVVVASRGLAVPPLPTGAEASADPAAETVAAAGPPGPDETRRISPAEVAPAVDPSQTVRLDEAGLDYVLPEINPEELFREREGIDEASLSAGIADLAAPSENEPGAPAAPLEP